MLGSWNRGSGFVVLDSDDEPEPPEPADDEADTAEDPPVLPAIKPLGPIQLSKPTSRGRRRPYNLSSGLLPTFMVSLPGSSRREKQRRLLKTSSLGIQIFPAVHGRKVVWRASVDPDINYAVMNNGSLLIPYDRRPWLAFRNRTLSPGQIGCALSNYMLYRKCVDDDYPMIFLLEDDVHFLRGDIDVRNILSHLPDPDTFDIAYLQRPSQPLPVTEMFPGTGGYFYRTAGSRGTYGYVVTKRFCKRVYDSFVLTRDADGFLSRYARNNHLVVLTAIGNNRFVGLWGALQKASERDRA